MRQDLGEFGVRRRLVFSTLPIGTGIIFGLRSLLTELAHSMGALWRSYCTTSGSCDIISFSLSRWSEYQDTRKKLRCSVQYRLARYFSFS